MPTTTHRRIIKRMKKDFSVQEHWMPVFDPWHFGAIKAIVWFLEKYSEPGEEKSEPVTRRIFVTKEKHDDETEYYVYIDSIYEAYDITDKSTYPDIISAAKAVIFSPPENEQDSPSAVFGELKQDTKEGTQIPIAL